MEAKNNAKKLGISRKSLPIKITALLLAFTFVFQQASFAGGRSSAGGGEIAEFDVGRWAVGTAIGLGSFTLGSAVAGGMNAAAQGGTFAQGFSSVSTGLTLTNFANNYNIVGALGQVNRAVGLAGQYYGWDPRATIFISSVATGAIGGGLNPGQFGSAVSGTLNGVALGTINGAVEGGILAATANSDGEIPLWAGPVAGLAGGFATGTLAGGFTPQNGSFSFGNNFSLGTGMRSAAMSTVASLPSTALGIGMNYATAGMDRWDAYMVRQAASGLYPMAGAVLNPTSILRPTYQTNSAGQQTLSGFRDARGMVGISSGNTGYSTTGYSPSTPSGGTFTPSQSIDVPTNIGTIPGSH